jgi:hypothetical protein
MHTPFWMDIELSDRLHSPADLSQGKVFQVCTRYSTLRSSGHCSFYRDNYNRVRVIKSRRTGLAGQAYVAHMGQMKHECHILVGNVEGKRLLGRYSLTPKKPEYSFPCFKTCNWSLSFTCKIESQIFYRNGGRSILILSFHVQ